VKTLAQKYKDALQRLERTQASEQNDLNRARARVAKLVAGPKETVRTGMFKGFTTDDMIQSSRSYVLSLQRTIDKREREMQRLRALIVEGGG
jgi:hypothetical protein